MRILINHLTRMQPGYICVAGLEEGTGRHVRPVLLGQLGEHWVTRYGGPFDMGEIVDLGPVVDVAERPHIEDRRFQESQITSLGRYGPGIFWNVLRRRASRSLTDIFGPALQQDGQTCSASKRHANASLGLLEPEGRISLVIRTYRGRDGAPRQELRMSVSDSQFHCSLPVTDLRFYDDEYRPISRVVADVNRRLTRGVRVYLSVGLGRAFRKAPDDPPKHWLQVNNIHLADDPMWRLVDAPRAPYQPKKTIRAA